MKVVKSPSDATTDKFTVFLAGSIEMGTADDWQVEVANAVTDYDVVLYNPRREVWDASWEQRISNKPFLAQVKWEYDRLVESKLIFLYFDPKTKSPISLLELGMFAGEKKKKMIVCCPDKFYRKGNVEFVCKQYGIDLYDELPEAIKQLKKELFAYGV